MTALSEAPRGEVQAAVRATYAAFISTGIAFASWAARIPQVKDRLGLSPSGLGLVLLAIAAGSVIALPMSGPSSPLRIAPHGPGDVRPRAGVGLVVVAVGYRTGVAPVVAGLFAFGVGTGSWDVAMNVQGALVERRLGRAIMPRFHAGFSIGTVAGALGGRRDGRPRGRGDRAPGGHRVAVAIGVPLAVRGFIPDRAGPEEDTKRGAAARASLAAWRERRTILVGVFVLAFAFAEGSGNDWIGVALIDDHGVAPAVGTLGLAIFLAAMTAGRWFGPGAPTPTGASR